MSTNATTTMAEGDQDFLEADVDVRGVNRDVLRQRLMDSNFVNDFRNIFDESDVQVMSTKK